MNEKVKKTDNNTSRLHEIEWIITYLQTQFQTRSKENRPNTSQNLATLNSGTETCTNLLITLSITLGKSTFYFAYYTFVRGLEKIKERFRENQRQVQRKSTKHFTNSLMAQIYSLLCRLHFRQRFREDQREVQGRSKIGLGRVKERFRENREASFRSLHLKVGIIQVT